MRVRVSPFAPCSDGVIRQTRWSQKPVEETPCGFKSRSEHHRGRRAGKDIWYIFHVRTVYTKEILSATAAVSISISDVIRRLGKRWSGGLHTHVRNSLIDLGISTSHFLGQRANRGEQHRGGCARRPWTDILKLRSVGRRERTDRLRRALFEAGVPYICVGCRIGPIWREEPLVLEVNHKNGNNIDDRKKNLEFLCPNCHSQIPNHGVVAQMEEAARLGRAC